jgi:hypothetical protein
VSLTSEKGHGVVALRQRLLQEEVGVERKGDAAAVGRSRSGQRYEWRGEVLRKGGIKGGGACLALERWHGMRQGAAAEPAGAWAQWAWAACAHCLAEESEQGLGGPVEGEKGEGGRGCRVGPAAERGNQLTGGPGR